MRTRPLGRSGFDVSVLCLGTMTFGWTADERDSFAVMSAALDAGINFFDTADIYSSWSDRSYAGKTEEIMGRWFAEDPRRRDRVVLATKVRGAMGKAPEDQGLSHKHIVRAIEASLRRLRTDRVELYQAHWFDDAVPQEETLRAFDELVRSGKVRAVGCSNFTAPQLEDALALSAQHGLARYESLQPRYNLLQRRDLEDGLAALCARESVGVIPYSPLAGGFLTGKYQRGQGVPKGSRGELNARIREYLDDERNFEVLDELAAIAKRRGATVAAVALSWVVDASSVTSAIIGANTVAQLRESLPAVDLALTAEERAALDRRSARRAQG